MPPTSRELFGPLDAIHPSKLVDDATVYGQLSAPGSPFATEQRLIAGRAQTVYATLPATMRDFWTANARDFGRRTYVVFGDERYTYTDVWQSSVCVAAWLGREFQVRKGDRVGIAARNYPEFVTSFWAIALLGGVATVLNSFNDGDTLAFSVQDVGCRVVLCDGERYERLREHLPRLLSDTSLAAVVVMPWIGARRVDNDAEKSWLQHGERVFDYAKLMKAYADTQRLPPVVDIQPDDHSVILFTSGTTGRPKGVLSTQRQFLSCLRLASFAAARTLLRRRRPLPPPSDPATLDQSSVLILVPLTHTTGLQSGLTMATSQGAKMILMPSYTRDAAIQVARREEVRTILGIGFMVREIALAGASLPHLSGMSHGGSSSAKELPDEVSRHHADVVVSQGYGATELNGVAAGFQLDDYFARPTSAGKPPIGVELMVVDPTTGARRPVGEQGELWVRSPGRAVGYWNRPKETADTFLADGWYRTGDLAKIDDAGFVFIVDRLKDIIVRGGENISCTHVESALYAHPSVMDCIAVAIPDERLGERVGIVAIPKQGAGVPTEGELKQTLQKGLPRYAVPDYIWIRTEPLDRNPSGKILRNVVRQAVLTRIKEQGWSASSPTAKL